MRSSLVGARLRLALLGDACRNSGIDALTYRGLMMEDALDCIHCLACGVTNL